MHTATGNRSARLSARLAAWKAPRLTPVRIISCGPPQSSLTKRDHALEEPGLVGAMRACAVLEGDRAVRPRLAVEGVHAVDLGPAGVDEAGDRVDHAVALEFPRAAALGGEHHHRPAPVTVGDHRPGADPGRVQLELVAPHRHTARSRSVRWGWSASRQAV